MATIENVAAIENGARYIIRNVKGKTVLDLNGSDGRTSKSPTHASWDQFAILLRLEFSHWLHLPWR